MFLWEVNGLFKLLQIDILLYYTQNPDMGRETLHLINQANNVFLVQMKVLAVLP